MARSRPQTTQTQASALIQPPGVADYFNSRPLKTHSILIALSADILILARCEGAPATARYFSQRLNTPVTEKMIKSIKAKAATGQLAITRKELETAALAHPVSAIRMKREPSLCDPKCYRECKSTRGNPSPAKPRKKPNRKTTGTPEGKPKTECHPPAPQCQTELAKSEHQAGIPNLVSEFFNSKFAPKPPSSIPRGILGPYAAEVVLIARMSSIQIAADFFSQKLGRKISCRPVETILSNFRHGKFEISPEELAAVAGKHPDAQKYLEANPDILNPKR